MAGDSFGEDLAVFFAGSVDGGHQLGTTAMWLHAMVAEGGMGTLDGGGSTMSSSYFTIRAGAEARWCMVPALCTVGGLDLGFRHEHLIAADEQILDNRLIAVARAGLDIGGAHFRFRPGIEISFGSDGADGGSLRPNIVDGLALTASVAYLW